ncbi:hypothetical protein [Paenibacillus cisolokensis]|uniref:hypothetical protein n=1 Tax=Paenibacillus cisolokensis TaxID=1658519 RepID=UPI001BCA99B8|nr:hypothetical protein [Paenibacillus cisolokensis]
MSVQIHINGDNAGEAIQELAALAAAFTTKSVEVVENRRRRSRSVNGRPRPSNRKRKPIRYRRSRTKVRNRKAPMRMTRKARTLQYRPT